MPIARITAVAAGMMALLVGRPANARANGIVVPSCSGCHAGLATATATLVANQSTINPGDLVTLTLTIQSPSIRDGGAYVTSGGTGTLQPIAGEGLAANPIDGLTHSAPKAASGSAVTFRFNWQAPATPGGVTIDAYVVAGNGNNAPSGDTPGAASFQAVFGCAGRQLFWDRDEDGYGTAENGTRLECADAPPPKQRAANGGDCDDNDPTVHPGVTEACNGKDDNCDGQIDESAPAVMLWPDPDGDGYYQYQTGTPRIGCAGIPGYAAAAGDCAPTDPTIHPGAKEGCNGKDDNCDGRIDEGVRPRCGTGWCQRESPTCDLAGCVPGPPHAETCNLLDDDCDGDVDNDATCPAGLECLVGACVSAGSSGAGSGGTGGSGASSGASSGGAGSAGTSDASAVTGSAAGAEPRNAGCNSCRAGGDGSGSGWAIAGVLAAMALAACRSSSSRRSIDGRSPSR